jgi:hypothetical protein
MVRHDGSTRRFDTKVRHDGSARWFDLAKVPRVLGRRCDSFAARDWRIGVAVGRLAWRSCVSKWHRPCTLLTAIPQNRRYSLWRSSLTHKREGALMSWPEVMSWWPEVAAFVVGGTLSKVVPTIIDTGDQLKTVIKYARKWRQEVFPRREGNERHCGCATTRRRPPKRRRVRRAKRRAGRSRIAQR